MADEAKGNKMTEGILTDEMIEGMRRKIGLDVRIDDYINNEYASKVAIRKFADGIGDFNPLWRDEDYAAKTRYGRIVAPPHWVWSVCAGVQMGWRGLGAFHSGTEEEFYKPILLGDKITPKVVFKGFDGPMSSNFAERMIKDFYDTLFYNQRGELVAKLHWWVFRYERGKAREKGKYKAIELPHPWTDEQIEQVEKEALEEEIRGGTTRFWEDVQVGDEMKPLVKGPIGYTDMIAYIAGGAISVKFQAHGISLREYKRHPAWAFRDPETHALEPVFAVHYNQRAANYQGLPFCYDLGIQRQCWLDNFLTNWTSDEGWLKRCYAQYRAFVYVSDALWFKGKVTKKYVDQDNEHCVDLELSVTNQRGENVMPGNATVALPSRETGTYPVQKRLG